MRKPNKIVKIKNILSNQINVDKSGFGIIEIDENIKN